MHLIDSSERHFSLNFANELFKDCLSPKIAKFSTHLGTFRIYYVLSPKYFFIHHLFDINNVNVQQTMYQITYGEAYEIQSIIIKILN